MRTFFISIAFLFSLTTSYAQASDSTKQMEAYDFDTTLKGGYTILFTYDDSLEYLYLKKNNKIISEIAACSKGLPYKNLGYVASDFKDYFVLAHSFGSGNPHSIELIKKSTGKNTLDFSAAWIDADEEKQLLLYSRDEIPTSKNKMILYNLQTGKKEYYSFPKDLLGLTEIFNRIQIAKFTNKEFAIRYETNDGAKTKVYSR